MTASTTPAAPSLADELIDTIAPLLAQQRQKWAERCHAHGLSLVGFQVVALLEMHGPMPMTRLADELGVALPNATGIVGRLAERDIVSRGADPSDRRVVRIDLTDAGRSLINDMESARRDRLRRLVGVLDDDQQRRLLRSVRDLQAAAIAIGASKEPA
ncbi:MAG TPA: MarR family transcriptional regulator [Candidatus Limnocylindria bacterium]